MGSIVLVLIIAYVVLFIFARRRQKAFDAQYVAMKERHEVFVLSKRRLRERGEKGFSKYIPVRTYQVVGRITVGQTMKGVNMNRVQNVTFRTTKDEYERIEVNRKYRMDIMGNYIGAVIAEVQSKRAQRAKGRATDTKENKPKRRFLGFGKK